MSAIPKAKKPAFEIGRETRLDLFRLQLELRMCEKRAFDLFLQNMIKGTSHLSLGQEAIAAAFGVAMKADDYTFCTYRGHAHTLARGASMTGVLGELMGRECGLLGGKGGSMHLTDVEKGVMGSYAIIGAHLPIAAGAAWSAQYRGTKQVAVCFFGDGTTNIGAFHEALNFSVIWNLPVVFVCENNFYMEYTPIRSVTAVDAPAADRAAAYGLPSIIVDGNDADIMYETAMAAIDKALENNARGRPMRGASTISQQVAKNLFLWDGRSWLRKGLEAWYTLLIELFWPKQRILEVYANIAEFGDGVYGAEAAAQAYFGKPAHRLNAAESARLAAVLPSPKRYSVRAPGPYVQRRSRGIQRQMQRLGGPSYLDGCCHR
jgi:monofunctional biosynthetic peptidoglycan transglycosylase